MYVYIYIHMISTYIIHAAQMIDGSTQNFEGKGGPGLGTTRQHTAAHCLKLQHTAAHCNALQHTITHCNTLERTATQEEWRSTGGARAAPAFSYGVASASRID